MVFRVELDHLDADKLRDHHQAGYFYEYMAHSLDDIAPLCGEKCQTVTTFGVAVEDIHCFMSQTHPVVWTELFHWGKACNFLCFGTGMI